MKKDVREKVEIAKSLSEKKQGDKLTVDELACALYEGTPHLSNLAETLARQHGTIGALTFFGMMPDYVQKFWKLVAKALIEHSSHYTEDGLDAEEKNRLTGDYYSELLRKNNIIIQGK